VATTSSRHRAGARSLTSTRKSWRIELALGALASGDREVAEKVIRHKSIVNTMERQLRAAHIQRLHEGLRESIDTSSIHLDLLASLKRANSLVTGIAYAVLGQHDA